MTSEKYGYRRSEIKFSICLNTHQVMMPMMGMDKDIFSVLTDRLREQSLQDFELVIIDRLFKERKESFRRARFSFPLKYCPPKPSPWLDVDPGAITIASDRNSGIILARGDLILCLDDCVVPMHADFLAQIWEWWEKDVLLRPLIFSYDFSKGYVKIDSDPLVEWKKKEPSNRYLHEVSGHIPKAYLLPASVWEQVNGVDERFDGAYGGEDLDLWNRVDTTGLKRYILGDEEQYHLGSVYHSHKLRDFRKVDIYNVCNHAYGTWRWKKIHDDRVVTANDFKITDDDIDEIRDQCSDCQNPCEREPWGLGYYRQFQPVFSLKEIRAKMIDRFGDRTGAFDPWL